GEAKVELIKQNVVADVRKGLRLRGAVEPKVYRGLTFDTQNNILYNHKRITSKRGSKLKLLNVNTLLRNPDSREFLRLIGYTDRDIETVAPEQTAAVKSKLASFKATEDWAKTEKEKAVRQLKETQNVDERKKLEESVQYFDQMEIQAKRRYNELMQNQLKRINSIINDDTRPIGERLKELLRREGLTIGALITAIGMTISTIVLALIPHSSPIAPNPGNNGNYIDKAKAAVKQTLVKIANWLLDLAKKALTALPGVIGSVVGFLLKKAGEAA